MWVGTAFRDAAQETDRAAEDLVAADPSRLRRGSGSRNSGPSPAPARRRSTPSAFCGYPATTPKRCGNVAARTSWGSGAAAHGDMAAVTSVVDAGGCPGLEADISLRQFGGRSTVDPGGARLGGDGGDAELREALGTANRRSGGLGRGWWGHRGSPIAGRGFGEARLTGGGAQSIVSRCAEAGIAVEHFRP